MSNSQKTNVIPIIMMFLLFAMIAIVTNLCNPMAVIVKTQFGASNFEAQLGTSANFIAYLVMGIPSGLLLKKIGYKKTALLAIAIGFIGILRVHVRMGKHTEFWCLPTWCLHRRFLYVYAEYGC